jgi:hypothetical protein
MVYFSNTPVALDSVDIAQYDALKQFRKWCESKGLIATYDNLPDFERAFTRDLQISLNKNPYLVGLRSRAASTPQVVINPSNTSNRSESLSAEAKELVREAATDHNGQILKMQTLGGTHIQTNGKLFGDVGDRRTMVRWEYALEQLEAAGLVHAKGHPKAVFVLTAKGYDVADQLKSEPI